MDAIFAILVLGAVIFFGALISAGNERQRKAIDGIREQAAQWAMQDLRIKREHLARDVKVDDPVAWLNQVIAKAVGEDLELVVTEVFDNPQALVCVANDGRKIVFTPISPSEIGVLRRGSVGRLTKVAINNPLLILPGTLEYRELSILNAGILFDLEFSIAWTAIAGYSSNLSDSLWFYFVD